MYCTKMIILIVVEMPWMATVKLAKVSTAQSAPLALCPVKTGWPRPGVDDGETEKNTTVG